MSNEELEENVKFVMAHLDEVLNDNDGFFDDIVNYEVLYRVRNKLNKEFRELINIINHFKSVKDFHNVKKYQEAINYVKFLDKKLSVYKDNYSKRLKKKKQKSNTGSKKVKASVSKPYKEKIKFVNPYEEKLHFTSPYYNSYFGELLLDLKTSKYFEEYSISLKTVFPVEVERKLSKTVKLNQEELLNLSILGRDVVLNKIRSIDKSELYADSEIVFLKKMIKIFEELKPVSYEPIDEDTSTYYDILEGLIDNDANYTYISKLMREIPNFVDARKDNKHFLFLLLDRFIENYKLKLVNQGLPYVEPGFYKELISLNFSLAPYFSEQEKLDFSISLVTFKDYVISKNYNDSEKVFEDIDFIANSMNNIEIKEEKIDDKVKEELFSLKYKMADVSNLYLRNNYNISPAFKFNNISNYVFSVDYGTDGNIVFKIHILDTASFIKDDCLIYEEMKSSDLDLPRFELNSFYPAMTFVYTIFSNNKISDVRVTSSIVNISEEYNNQDLDNYRDNSYIKGLFGVFKRMKESRNLNINYYNQNGINDFVDTVLNEDIIRNFENGKMPFIYKTYLENGEDLVRINHNAVCDKLMNIPKKEAHKVFDILDEVYDSYYVPNNGKLELDSSKFLGLYLLTTIHRVMDGVYDISKVEEELNELLVTLNNKEKYLPSSVLKNNERNIKRLVRIYKKNNKKDVV